MTNKNFMTAQDVADALGVSKSYAYELVRQFFDEQIAQFLRRNFYIMSGCIQCRICISPFIKKYVTANKGKEVVEWLYTKIMPQERGG